MKKIMYILSPIVLASLMLSACGTPTAAPIAVPTEAPVVATEPPAAAATELPMPAWEAPEGALVAYPVDRRCIRAQGLQRNGRRDCDPQMLVIFEIRSLGFWYTRIIVGSLRRGVLRVKHLFTDTGHLVFESFLVFVRME